VSNDLKPCPFCGGKVTFARDPEDMSEISGIYCLACKAYVKWTIPVKETDTFGQTMEAWAGKWNRRDGSCKQS